MTDFLTVFIVILLAELGDKSQLVCMLMAARHHPFPVITGATLAFSLLNLLAVGIGHFVSALVDIQLLQLVAVLLFFAFAINSLLLQDDDEDDPEPAAYHSILITTFMMILLAEMGDKTQLSTAMMSASLSSPVMVWLASTSALFLSCSFATFAGQWLGSRTKAVTMHRISGLGFMFFAGWLLNRLIAEGYFEQWIG